MTTNRLTVDAADLKAAAQWAARILPPRPAVPVLGALVLNARDGLLSLSAFDFETYGSIGLPVTGGGFDDEILVHGRMLAEAAARLTGTVRAEVSSGDLVLTAGRTTIRVRTLPGDDYPEVPPAAPTLGTIDAETFAEVIRAAVVCAARDQEKLPHLTRIRLETTDGHLTAWASDRYRAAQVHTPWDGRAFDLLINATAVSAATKGLTGTLDVGVDEHRLTLTGADRTTTISLSQGGDWTNLARLWSDRGGHVHVDRDALTEAIATARLAADGTTPTVVIDVDTNANTVTVGAAADRGQASTTLDGAGDLTVRWVINAAFLFEVVAVLNGPRVLFAADPAAPEARAIEVRGADTDGEPADDTTYLVIPIRQQVRR